MKYDLPDIALIERYLEGELAGQELVEFETAMESDQQIKSAVEEHLKSLVLAKAMGEEQWREQMKRQLTENPVSDKVFVWPTYLKYVAAAAIVLLLVIGGLWMSQNETKPDLEEWLTIHLETPVAPERMSTDQDSLLSATYYAYNQGKYEEALAAFPDLLPYYTGGYLRELFFFEGMCHFKLQQYPEARQSFVKIDRGAFQETALWYTGISYIKEKNFEAAKPVLQSLIDHDAFFFYRSQAQELLDIL